MKCSPFALLLALIALPPVTAAEKLPPELALIPKDAAAFISIRYDLMNKSPLGKASIFGDGKLPESIDEIERLWLGFPLTEVERVTAIFPSIPGKLSLNIRPLLAVTRSKPIDRRKHVTTLDARPVVRDAEKRKDDRTPRRGEFFILKTKGWYTYVGERSLLIGWQDSFEDMLGLLGRFVDPPTELPLSSAIEAANAGNVIVAGVSGETVKQLLAAVDGRRKEFLPLGDAIAVTLIANLDPEFRLKIEVSFANEKSAAAGLAAVKAFKDWTTDSLKGLASSPQLQDAEMSKLFLGALRGAAEPKRDGLRVSFAAEMKIDEFGKAATAGLQSAVLHVRSAADRMKASNYLKQIGIGIHEFHDVYGKFGFRTRPKDGVHAGLSWRVQLLPYIEEDNLYRLFRVDEPWDSEHNKKLIEKMPKLFAPPPSVRAKAGHTYLRMFDGPDTVFRVDTFKQIKDGSSNTLMVVEAAESTIWTKPDELPYDPKKPLPKLGGHFPDGFNVLFADGSVKFLRHGIDEDFLRAIITVDGGEKIDLDDKK